MSVEGAAPEPSEQDLVDRARGGDGAALTRLLYAYYEPLLRRLRRKLKACPLGALDAEDVLQEAHVRAFAGVRAFEPRGPNSFYPWLRTIADHVLIDRWRAQCRFEEHLGRPVAPAPLVGHDTAAGLLDLVAFDGETPSRSAARREAAQALRVALAGLPPRQREAVCLVCLLGLAPDEAARRMGATAAAVRALVDRARDNLREALGSMSRYLSR
jgi:RNA polymerase sigma-70 factor (ECF subfamily)